MGGTSDHNPVRSWTTLLFPLVEYPEPGARGSDRPVATALERYLATARALFARHGGREGQSADGSLLGAFEQPIAAIAASADLQQALAREPWPAGARLAVRVGLHSGAPTFDGGRYGGFDVDRVAAISQAAHGGQVLMSSATRARLGDAPLPAGTSLRELGWHRLAGLQYPETLVELALAAPGGGLPPVRSLASQPGNLRAADSVFVGRAEAVRELRAQLLRADTRVVTLTGASGSGRTRLALEAAAGLPGDFPDGVFEVGLRAATDARLAAAAIARVLAIPEAAEQSVLDALTHHLASKRALLVLDGLDPEIGAAPLLAQLLSSCAQLRALVTSSAALGLGFEREYDVGALSAKDAKVDAAALFVARAHEAQPAFVAGHDDRQAIGELCAQLEGLPLAIELAAAQMKRETPRTLAVQLGARLRSDADADAPRASSAGTPALQAVIASSYALLEHAPQAVLRRAAVFAGGLELEAAAQVLAAPGETPDRVARHIEALVDSGLLQRERRRGGTRLLMHEAVRAYGLRLLAQHGEHATAGAAHARYFAALAERAAPELMGRDQRSYVQALLAESDNLRAALDHTLESGDLAAAAALTRWLLWLWIPQGMFSEGTAFTERALHAGERARSRERALLLEAAGWLALFSGNLASATREHERALALFQELGAPADVARARLGLALALAAGRMPQGPARVLEALAAYRTLRDPHGTALALIALGDGARASGDDAAAAGRYEEALALLRAIGNVYWQGQLLQNLAHFRLHQGSWRNAAALLGEALELGREYNQPMLLNLYVAAMGGLGVVRGRAREGARLLGAASAAVQRMGAAFGPIDQQELERHMAAARSRLGDEAFERAFAEGSHWPLDLALREAGALQA